MKRMILLLVLAFSASAYSQVLYSISGNGLQQPSYVLGIIPFVPESYVDSIPGLREVIKNVGQGYGEMGIEEPDVEKEAEADEEEEIDHSLPDDLTMEELLSAEDVALTDSLLNLDPGIDMSDEDQKEYLHTLDLRFIATLLLQNRLMPPAGSYGLGIEGYIQTLVPAYGGLETSAYQEKILFPPMTAAKQKDYLHKTLANIDALEKANRAIVTAYRTQDIKAIEAAYDYNKLLEVGLQLSTQKEMDEMEDRTINRRNQQWVQRMPRIMSQKPTLFTFGVGHLLGEKGVLQLLRKGGYKVNPVKTQ
ncbi:MAG: TraB/GumN family protein [Prevotella sp.]|nr:TraB/GumN family protein [Prevotella sp.]